MMQMKNADADILFSGGDRIRETAHGAISLRMDEFGGSRKASRQGGTAGARWVSIVASRRAPIPNRVL
jgi:hypothetical protein